MKLRKLRGRMGTFVRYTASIVGGVAIVFTVVEAIAGRTSVGGAILVALLCAAAIVGAFAVSE